MKSRREALRTLGAGALLPALQAQHEHPGTLVQLTEPAAPKHITGDDFTLLGQLVELMIPRTDTPGALDAGVPFFIDRAVGLRAELGATLRAGLEGLRGAGFVQADARARIAMLKSMEQAADPFFKLLKDLTIDGYYTSQQGLTRELGYHGNTYLREFAGCTHPQHQGTASDAD